MCVCACGCVCAQCVSVCPFICGFVCFWAFFWRCVEMQISVRKKRRPAAQKGTLPPSLLSSAVSTEGRTVLNNETHTHTHAHTLLCCRKKKHSHTICHCRGREISLKNVLRGRRNITKYQSHFLSHTPHTQFTNTHTHTLTHTDVHQT